MLRAVPRRRILVLTPRDPYPVIGGDRVRIHRLARELSKHHDMTLVTLCRSRKDARSSEGSDDVFKAVHRVFMPEWRSWLNAAAALPSSEPLQVAYYRSTQFRELAESLAPAHDAVLAHLIRTADYARNMPAVRMLDMSDALSMNMQRVISTNSEHFDLRRVLYGVEARRLLAHERGTANDFDLITLTSPVDSAYVFESMVTCNVMVVPNGGDIPNHTPPPQALRSRHEIVFIGNLHSLQNFDGLWFFARHVLPRVRSRFPKAVLRVIGPIRPIARRRLAALPGVQIEGVVPRLDTALATARIGICPVRMGSGIKNKILDYFANRLAVVSSYGGIEGLDVRANQHVLLAETPDEWATQVNRLLEDDLTAQRLADAGRELVCRKYRWEQCVQPMVSRLNGLLAGQPAVDVDVAAAASQSLRA